MQGDGQQPSREWQVWTARVVELDNRGWVSIVAWLHTNLPAPPFISLMCLGGWVILEEIKHTAYARVSKKL
jgi:hypothetical protein